MIAATKSANVWRLWDCLDVWNGREWNAVQCGAINYHAWTAWMDGWMFGVAMYRIQIPELEVGHFSKTLSCHKISPVSVQPRVIPQSLEAFLTNSLDCFRVPWLQRSTVSSNKEGTSASASKPFWTFQSLLSHERALRLPFPIFCGLAWRGMSEPGIYSALPG